jgi:hypothetical protein
MSEGLSPSLGAWHMPLFLWPLIPLSVISIVSFWAFERIESLCWDWQGLKGYTWDFCVPINKERSLYRGYIPSILLWEKARHKTFDCSTFQVRKGRK